MVGFVGIRVYLREIGTYPIQDMDPKNGHFQWRDDMNLTTIQQGASLTPKLACKWYYHPLIVRDRVSITAFELHTEE